MEQIPDQPSAPPEITGPPRPCTNNFERACRALAEKEKAGRTLDTNEVNMAAMVWLEWQNNKADLIIDALSEAFTNERVLDAFMDDLASDHFVSLGAHVFVLIGRSLRYKVREEIDRQAGEISG